jgi:hypothetical protein
MDFLASNRHHQQHQQQQQQQEKAAGPAGEKSDIRHDIRKDIGTPDPDIVCPDIRILISRCTHCKRQNTLVQPMQSVKNHLLVAVLMDDARKGIEHNLCPLPPVLGYGVDVAAQGFRTPLASPGPQTESSRVGLG